MTDAPLSPELVDRIATAIADADERCRYCCRLTRLVDNEATYTLYMQGSAELLYFSSHEEAMDHVDVLRNRARAEAVIAALGMPA